MMKSVFEVQYSNINVFTKMLWYRSDKSLLQHRLLTRCK